MVARRELVPGRGRATVVTAAPPEPDPAAALEDAVRAARDADAAIMVVGTTEHSETEEYDRAGLSLGGHQDELVRAIAAANPRTVVIVNSGGPVELPWRDEVGAVLLTWFPGQEAGAGLADVLFGRTEPGGRLPTTWAATSADAPVVTRTRPVDGRLDYAEGLHIGHRAWLQSRTRARLLVRPRTQLHDVGVRGSGGPASGRGGRAVHRPGDSAQRRCPRRARGRAGLPGPPGSAVERPVRWLAGYAAVRAAAGRTANAEVVVRPSTLRHWSEAGRGWTTEPGPTGSW
ncbi:glycoside hydrolase family 3 C-terminal domain-containing protein [Streptomyces thinghirensis]|nr:glycoside hydrolase family 3 C-terminal domain-containing protein [Streptomyces thinghirensis]